jgi:hypothetical protein
MSVFPITFSIPNSKIVDNIPKKTKILSNLIPGNISTYIYQNESDYYNEYRSSFFAITTKKGGWDCMRHYEILANGCIPYFPNIENCPLNTMALLPKNLILEGNQLYEKYKNININDFSIEQTNECNSLIQKLLDYTRNNLTTKKIASYILKKTNFENIKSVLYLSGDTGPDYLRCVTLQGFKEIFGFHCHDYPKMLHIYKTNSINYSALYGKGITYTNNLDETLHNDVFDKSIEYDIRNKKYDIIIYGSYHRGMPLYDLVTQIYNPNEIILLCGEDTHYCNYNNWLSKGHNIFVREL